MTGRRWSIVQRCAALGFSSATSRDHWCLGRRVADHFRARNGAAPSFDYCPKTDPDASGTHYHALYEEGDLAWIDQRIRDYFAGRDRQGFLPFMEPER